MMLTPFLTHFFIHPYSFPNTLPFYKLFTLYGYILFRAYSNIDNP